MSLTKISLGGGGDTLKLFPARESLFSDILAGDGKIANLFYSVRALRAPFDFMNTGLSTSCSEHAE